jgi:hypothetical protein
VSGYTNVDGICKIFGIESLIICYNEPRPPDRRLGPRGDDARDPVTVHRAQIARPRRTADGVRARGSTLDSNDVLHPRVTLVSTETRRPTERRYAAVVTVSIHTTHAMQPACTLYSIVDTS